MKEFLDHGSSFLDMVHFTIPEKPQLEEVTTDPLAYLKDRETRLIEELATVRRILSNCQGYEPTITYTLYDTRNNDRQKS